MDGSIPVMTTQAILIWTLLGILLAWLIIFAVLALRPDSTDIDKSSDLPQLPHTYSIISTSTTWQVMPPQPVSTPITTDRQDTGEMEVISIV